MSADVPAVKMTEPPLHVRVAEALGWTNIHHGGSCDEPCPSCGHHGDIMIPEHPGAERWRGRAPGNGIVGPPNCHEQIPFYHTDWSVTGPLIDRFTISIEPVIDYRTEAKAGTVACWWAGRHSPEQSPVWAGASLLEAVCRFIVFEKEAGRL